MRHLLMPQTKEQAEEFLRLAEAEAARFGIHLTQQQEAEPGPWRYTTTRREWRVAIVQMDQYGRQMNTQPEVLSVWPSKSQAQDDLKNHGKESEHVKDRWIPFNPVNGFVQLEIICKDVEVLHPPKPAAPDARCEGCGYMTHHREHVGCVRAAQQQKAKPEGYAYEKAKRWSRGEFTVMTAQPQVPEGCPPDIEVREAVADFMRDTQTLPLDHCARRLVIRIKQMLSAATEEGK